MTAIKLYRVAHALHRRRIPVLPGLLTKLIYLMYNCYIPSSCEIGTGTQFGYGGIGIVIHARAKLGTGCVVGSGVTIGGRSKIYEVPVIGDRVYLGTGCKVLGNVRIGDDVVIGANAVVTTDIPEGCVAAGVPAKVIRRGIRMEDYV